ncbi:PREDICTED: uncharacterized protein LOC104807507 isoform X2 [Tarenaya hassleriana]|uniref:uncharacterized protein LOC104807507 isoform X2 n=1 Tax=Tarenaya hassleriana TaxID=28532 RepID=UPI00053C88E6|nr:PREDICTED: uncharacterized protein LOC104807507 isoform X2 [Tarenaya hassleriana]
MVRFSTVLLKDAGYVTDDSRVPSLQAVPEMKYGIPCLAPRGGKILSEEGDVQTFDDFVLLQKLMDYWIRISIFALQMASSPSSSSTPIYEDIQVSFVYDFNDIHHVSKITTKCYPVQTTRSLKKALTNEE